MNEHKKRLFFLAKHGPEHTEKATLPFAMALGAMATDIDAVIALQSDAVLLAKAGVAEHVRAAGMEEFKKLLDLFLADGGTLLVCTACISAREIDPADIIEGAELASVARLSSEFSEATNVVSY